MIAAWMARPANFLNQLAIVFMISLLILALYLISRSPDDSSFFTETPLAPIQDDSLAKNLEIPRILHQTFATEMVYGNYRPFINSCLSLNPNWTYYLWRDSDALALLAKEYPEYLKIYANFDDNLQRADAIRYVILHRFGGIYLDMDVECLKPFHPALTRQAAFLDQERLEQTRILWLREFSAMNSLMGSVPGHPFYRLMADRVLTKTLPGSAVYSTGPQVLTQVFKAYRESAAVRDWPVRLLPPSVASPLMDSDKNWRHWCRSAKMTSNRPSRMTWRDRGCRQLQSKSWRLNDTDRDTVAVHRFLHLGYDFAAKQRKPAFDMSRVFRDRVHFYSPPSGA